MHVIICDHGHIGVRSFELFQQLGIKVAVITSKPSEDWRKKVEEAGGLFLVGDASTDALLTKAGIVDAFAILAATDQDLFNVSIVMNARRLNPKIRIICRLFDTHLGKHISEAFGVSQIFSTSELAAQVFVSAFDDLGAVARSNYRGQPFLLTETEQVGVAPLVTVDHSGKTSARLYFKPIQLGPEKAGSMLNSLFHWVFRPSLMKFRRVVSLIVVVIIVSSMIVKWQMPLSWIDAFYFVTTTVTTVGYGDINFSTASTPMKIFGIVLMLVGTTSIAILFSTVAESLLSERLSSLFGGRVVPRKDHVIIVGADHIGVRVAEQLAVTKTPMVVVEDDKVGRFPADVKRRVAVIDGDARNPETLQQANAVRAKAVLVVSNDDVWNLSIGLNTQSLNPNVKTIVRVFDADLGDKLQSKLALSKILSVSGVAAPYFVAASLADNIAAATRWQNRLVILSERSAKLKEIGTVQVPGMDHPLSVSVIPLEA